MTGAIVLDGETLTPEAVTAVARGGARVELSPTAKTRNNDARDTISALLERGEPLYGATTGVGALRDRTIGAADRERFQWNLLRSHAVSAGRPLAPELVRSGMVVRANQLGAGGAGVAPALLDALVEALNDRDHAAHARAGLARHRRPAGAGRDRAGAARRGPGVARRPAYRRGGAAREPIDLGLRDGLGFMSSGAMTAGHAALLTVDARSLHARWLEVAALSFEALEADPVVLDPRVQAARGARGQAAVAATDARAARRRPVRSALARPPRPGSVCLPGAAAGRRRGPRCARPPRRGAGPRAQRAPRERADPRGRALPTGNFHAAELGAALDGLRAAFAHSASLIAGRVSAMLDPRMSGLSPFLAAEPGRTPAT